MSCDIQFDHLYGKRSYYTYHEILQSAYRRNQAAERGELSKCETCGADFSWPKKKAAELRKRYLLKEAQKELTELEHQVTRVKARITKLAPIVAKLDQRDERMNALKQESMGLGARSKRRL